MLRQTSLTNVPASCNRGVSRFQQPTCSLVVAGLLCGLFGQALLFGQIKISGSTSNEFCGKKPPLLQYTSLAYSQVAVATMFASGDAGPLGDRDLVIWNISTSPYTPLNTDWATYKFLPNPYYSDSRWNYLNLGDVVGLTLDDKGNIYLAATTAYGPGRTGGLADPSYPMIGRHGQIYKIDAVTGEPTAFVQLPNWHGAGLGNITFDSFYRSFYVANEDDGLIYQLDGNGATVKTWDHGRNLKSATDLSGKSLGIKDNLPCYPPQGACKLEWDSLGYARLGRRPLAVRVYQSRLYYSIWSNDKGLAGTGEADSPSANQIWSVALDPTGGFSGSARLELTLPAYGSYKWSNPVFDLTFSPKGTMIVAERTMAGDHTPSAHNSRVLEFDWKGTFWVLSLSSYATGCDDAAIGFPTNSAGGVDFDQTQDVPAGAPRLQVWATADKMHRNNEGGACKGFSDDVYGLQGFPPGGGTIGNSVLIDLDAYTKIYNKTQLGGVRIPCPEPPPTGPSSQ